MKSCKVRGIPFENSPERSMISLCVCVCANSTCRWLAGTLPVWRVCSKNVLHSVPNTQHFPSEKRNLIVCQRNVCVCLCLEFAKFERQRKEQRKWVPIVMTTWLFAKRISLGLLSTLCTRTAVEPSGTIEASTLRRPYRATEKWYPTTMASARPKNRPGKFKPLLLSRPSAHDSPS